MQNTWPVVAFAAIAAVFVGAIVGMARSGSAVQSKAIGWSFCSLALVAAFCCVASASGVLASLTWLFAVVLVVVPAGVYACVVLSASRETAASSTARSSARASATMATSRQRAARMKPPAAPRAETEVDRPAVREVRFSPIETSIEQVVVEKQRTWATPTQVPAWAPAEDDVRVAVEKDTPEAETHRAKALVEKPLRQEPAAAYPPPLGEVKPVAVGPAAVAPTAPAELAAQVALAASVEPAPKPAPGFQHALPPSPEPALPAAPAAQTHQPTSDDCFQKAAAFKARGLHVPAARLFAEAAALADGDTARRRARFEELSCYVKADQPDKARPLVEALSQSSVLTKVERVKLEAAGRLL